MNIKYAEYFNKYLYPTYNRAIGRDSFGAAKERMLSQHFSRSDLDALKLSKLKKVLINANENIPFYSKRFAEIDFNPINLMTLQEFDDLEFSVTKNDLINEPEEFISNKCDRRKLNWHLTGGSTGAPLNFATDRNTDTSSASALIRALSWWGVDIGARHAIFWGSPTYVIRNYLDFRKYLFNIVRDKLMNRMYISNYDLTDDNMLEYYNRIIKFRPVYIRGMASSLYVFSQFLKRKNLSLSAAAPVFVHSACEHLYEWQKVSIEETFKCPVANTYGLSELADIAYGSSCGNMHILEEDVHLSLSNIKSGPKQILATQLNNMSTPLIKYETGDIASNVKGDCSCDLNLHTLEGLEGRVHDFILKKDGAYVHGQFFTHLIVYEEGINNYQIIQSDLSNLIINLVVNNKYIRQNTESSLKKSIAGNMGSQVIVTFNYVDAISLTKSGKHRWIISELHD